MTSFYVHIIFMLLVAILVALATALFGASFSALLRSAKMLYGVVFLSRIFCCLFYLQVISDSILLFFRASRKIVLHFRAVLTLLQLFLEVP